MGRVKYALESHSSLKHSSTDIPFPDLGPKEKNAGKMACSIVNSNLAHQDFWRPALYSMLNIMEYNVLDFFHSFFIRYSNFEFVKASLNKNIAACAKI